MADNEQTVTPAAPPDKWQALQSFWSQFSLVAYDQNTVPEDAQLPYITYQAATGAWGDSTILTASLWYRSRSWEAISKKADEIANAIGWAGVLVQADDGQIWLMRGNPFAQRMSDPDDSIRRILFNLVATYQTT